MLNENAKLIVQLSTYIAMLEQMVQELQKQLQEAKATEATPAKKEK